MPRVQGQAELHSRFQAKEEYGDLVQKERKGPPYKQELGSCTADTRDAPAPHSSPGPPSWYRC